ncbi:MAG: arsenate reductase ArsC [Phycisphaerae bacterium]|nr:arsenate reductase ArsC [Phycisphaerae bacterium]
MNSKKEKLNVLFLCTGNSCRSQMAEGWARHLKSDCIEPFSAGVSPYKLSERAAQVMAEAGADISGQYSKHLDDLSGLEFDYVITVCDNAKEQCPIYPGKTKMIHHQFEDPTFAIGTKEQIMAEFRRIRDEIRDFIAGMPGNLES